jgi:N-acetylmuramoyl-L-alanine amidase
VKGSALVNRIQASPNHEPRIDGKIPRLIVLHYTGMASGAKAVDWLCNPDSKVSCHYLVDEDGTIVQMVDEGHRAWHAGTSSWHGDIDVNSSSIGIEIQNQGHTAGLPSFPHAQMRRVAELCLDIMQRWDMAPRDVVAHSDVAPGRKVDPGENFDWRYLAAQGIGEFYAVTSSKHLFSIAEAQTLLKQLGYGLQDSGVMDTQTRIVLEAFQRRYRPAKVDGALDAETSELVRRLAAAQPRPTSV